MGKPKIGVQGVCIMRMPDVPYFDEQLGITFESHNAGGDLMHHEHYANGGGISIITGPYVAYCTPLITYEVMVLGPVGYLGKYDNAYDDVIGHLSAEEVKELISRIKNQRTIQPLITVEGLGL